MNKLWVDVMNNSRVGRYMHQVEADFIAAHLPANPALVLDIGGGTGRWSRWLVERGHQQMMLELDTPNLRRFQEQHPDLVAVQGNAQDIPFPDNTFDMVVAVQIFGLLYEPEKFLREVHRVLKPHGLLFISWTNKTSLKGFLYDAYSWFKGTRFEDRVHFYQTSHRDNVAMLKAAQLIPIDGNGYSWVMLPRGHNSVLVDVFVALERGLRLNRWLATSPNVIVAARKN
jgi:ubiquinone/menaquinone biosynthesis C-methylase UbiE